MGSVTGMLLDDDDPADFVFVVKITGGYPYTAFGNSYECLLEQGLTSTDELKPVTCELESSTNQIIFRNVNKFTSNTLHPNCFLTCEKRETKSKPKPRELLNHKVFLAH